MTGWRHSPRSSHSGSSPCSLRCSQYFEAKKNTWKIFCIIARERKKRELEPALDTLREAVATTAPLTDDDARIFNGQVEQLADFLAIVSDLVEKVVSLEESQVVLRVLRLFK